MRHSCSLQCCDETQRLLRWLGVYTLCACHVYKTAISLHRIRMLSERSEAKNAEKKLMQMTVEK